jgi:hypothetical protein
VSNQVADEKRVFEQKLDKALDEAWEKVNKAVDQLSAASGDLEMSIRLAAESAEYSSALFSLTYGLEDLDPEVKIKRNTDSSVLVKDSLEALRKARDLRHNSTAEAYTSLRTAADFLKRAYLDRVKKSVKRPS